MFAMFPALLRNKQLSPQFTLNDMEIQGREQLPEARQCFTQFTRLRTPILIDIRNFCLNWNRLFSNMYQALLKSIRM